MHPVRQRDLGAHPPGMRVHDRFRPVPAEYPESPAVQGRLSVLDDHRAAMMARGPRDERVLRAGRQRAGNETGQLRQILMTSVSACR